MSTNGHILQDLLKEIGVPYVKTPVIETGLFYSHGNDGHFYVHVPVRIIARWDGLTQNGFTTYFNIYESYKSESGFYILWEKRIPYAMPVLESKLFPVTGKDVDFSLITSFFQGTSIKFRLDDDNWIDMIIIKSTS